MSLDVCDPNQEERCRKQDGSEEIHRWACEQCEKRKGTEIDAYTDYILGLRRMVNVGFPFDQDDLPVEIWEDIAAVDEMIKLRMRIF